MKKAVLVAISALLMSGSLAAFQPQELMNDQQNEIVTKNGTTIRKGTLYAMLMNSQEFDRLVVEPDSPAKKQQIDKIVADLNAIMPTLTKVGIFELFTPEEWIQNSTKHPGRALIALLYLNKNPDALTSNVKTTLRQLQSNAPKDLTPFFPKNLS